MKPFDDGSRDPAFQRHYARVLLAQARVFRLRGQKDGWLHSLINWAGEARRKSVQLTPRDLFGPQKTRLLKAADLRLARLAHETGCIPVIAGFMNSQN